MFKPPQPFRPKFGGVYPGSGIAPGGQQGRSTAMHNGITGARRGGHTPGASQRRPALRPPMPGGFRPADPQALLASLLSTSGLRR